MLHRTATALFVSLSISLAAPAAHACFGIRVTSFGDDRDTNNTTCTLRKAIRAANGNVAVGACPAGSATGVDRICLPAGTYTIDLSLSGQPESPLVGDLDVTGPVEIVGVASDVTKVVGTNGSAERLLSISDTAENVILRAITFEQTSTLGGVIASTETSTTTPVLIVDSVIRGARVTQGGGIQNLGVMLISASRIEGNQVTGAGGGIYNDGGTLTLDASEVSDNEAGTDGGGIYTTGSGKLSVNRSRIAGNRAPAGNGGGLYIASPFDVTYSHFSGNSARAGGGLRLDDGMGEIQRSAFVANSAITNGGGIDARSSTAIRASTLTQNSAGIGGAAYTSATQVLFDADTIAGNLGSGGVANQTGAFFESTLLAANIGGNCTGAAPVFGEGNLDDGSSCHFVNDPPNRPNLPNTQPLLGPLADNGGPTPTMALLPGSPAIDFIDSRIRTNCEKVQFLDQRGFARGRPRTKVGPDDVFHCDIGAYERVAPFVVGTGSDGVDASPDDDLCATALGPCTLRAAIQQAMDTPGYDEIELGARTHTLSLAGSKEDLGATGDLDLKSEVLVRGVGPASVIDAARIDRAFDLRDGLGAPNGYVLRDLRITRGLAPTGEDGGAIRSLGPKLRLERVVLDANAVSATDDGAAIFVQPLGGFQRRVERKLELISSTVTNNTGNMPLYASDGLISRSAIVENAQNGRGSEFSAVRVENSTFSGNFGNSWSVLFANQGFFDASTLYGNSTTSDPGAVFLLELSAFRNTIIANNLVSGALGDNCSMNQFGIQSLGHNLTDTSGADCAMAPLLDLVLTQPQLAPLADNGGPTRTHALQPGSPAIDTGDTAGCQALDQRGFFRPADGDANGSALCDIGAFERFAAADSDGDGLRDSQDNCPFWASLDQTDTDGDGRGNLCECTDQNGDGRNTVSDLIAINNAVFSPALATPLCDGNGDGLCNVSDIVAANLEIFSPTSTSICARQPVPGP